MKMMKKITGLFLLLLVSLYPCSAQDKFHDEIPDLPAKPALVNDLGDMLTPDEELLLETKLLNYEKSSSNEIAIVTVESLGGMEISDFAVELGRKWDIGKASKKNGVLILASKTDRKINISPAYGLQGVLPDVVCSRIIREQLVPQFKEGKIFAGFDLAVDRIIGYTKGEFTADEPTHGSGLPGIIVLLIIMVFIVIFMIAMRGKKGSTYVSRRGYRNNDSDWGGGFLGGMLGGSGSSWGSDSDSGGGFGGFGGGGGGFDGGGASGSW